MDCHGTVCDIDDELNKLLTPDCDVQSYHTFNDRCHLLISYRESQDSKAITRAKVAELDGKGRVCIVKELDIDKASTKIDKEVILNNQFGKLIQLRAVSCIETSETAEPTLNKGIISLITFESMQVDTQYAFTGDYFCWSTSEDVQVLNLKTEIKKVICLKSFTSYTGDKSFVPDNFQLDASDVWACVESGMQGGMPPSPQITQQGLHYMANQLQVTIGQ